jgi:predicted GNAT family acetyltransferase
MLVVLQTTVDDPALDHPIWAALTTGNKALAQGGPLAWRYPLDVAPFAAISDTAPEALEALRAVIPPEGLVALFTVDKVRPPIGLQTELEAPIIQMIARDAMATLARGVEHVVLDHKDVPDMLQLAERTRPGPFGPRTYELGEYIGIRVGGELAAMAGERMRLNGHVEISAVCVHPDHRGKGYAQILVARLMHKLREQGITPFLHVFADNRPAIALYERLGFAVRRNLYVTALRHATPENHS